MTGITLAYIRDTIILTDAMVASYVAAQQIQITRDFAPIWGVDATCVFVPPGQPVPPGSWEIWFKDHTDEDGALGYHTVDGNPRANIFTADAIADQVAWTVDASHETIETLGDPLTSKTVTVGDLEYAWENCDAVEDDRFGYLINGHLMSDFVTPLWFDAAEPPHPATSSAPSPFSFRGNVSAPFELAEGGYIGVRQLPSGAWTQRFALATSPRQRKRPTSRTMRRFRAAA